MKPPHSELAFASFLSYCPRGDAEQNRRSRDFMLCVKENRIVGTESASDMVARRLREHADADKFIDHQSVLVPIPRSGMHRDGNLWPAFEIASSLSAKGFGRSVDACLKRMTPVPKAATSRPSDRPKARAHFDSLDVDYPMFIPDKITLIDDIVTRGSQFFGAAWKFWSCRQDVEIRAFAVIRTVSLENEFDHILSPRVGKISWRNEECKRRP